MACETRLRPRQTLSERMAEVKGVVAKLDRLLLTRKVKPVVGQNGAIAFQGFPESERSGVSDACIYRRIMATGSALARNEIARAEQMAGRTVNRQVLAAGIHSHDGGQTWDQKG